MKASWLIACRIACRTRLSASGPDFWLNARVPLSVDLPSSSVNAPSASIWSFRFASNPVSTSTSPASAALSAAWLSGM